VTVRANRPIRMMDSSSEPVGSCRLSIVFSFHRQRRLEEIVVRKNKQNLFFDHLYVGHSLSTFSFQKGGNIYDLLVVQVRFTDKLQHGL